ncbi:MAG TPA: HAD family phosphatase [Cellulomonas sp.]
MARAALPAAVLWDLDGTLVDTEPLWREEEAALVARHGGTWSIEDGLALVGTALPAYAQALRGAGVQLSEDEIITWISRRIIARQAEAARWQPGARELVAALHAAGVPQALVTSSYRNLTEPVIRDSDGAFAAVVPGDEVERPKPDPEPYLLAARRLHVDPAMCVVVEDSRVGVAAALACGAHVLAVESEVQLPDDPRLSRAVGLTAVGVDDLARIASGEVLELRGETV